MSEINYYKANEILENKYYRMPQKLFENSLYQYTTSVESKLLYMFLLDRLTLSQENGWCDEEGNVYLIFTRKEVQKKLCLFEKTASKAFAQLVKVNLISEKGEV